MRKELLSLFLLGMVSAGAYAQRPTDKIDRGLVAVKTSSGVFCSWRMPAEEYYDVQYNIYRDGTKLNDKPLNVSNFTDKSGSTTSQYSVEAVVRGKTQEKSTAVTPWAKNYMEIKIDHGTLKSNYIPNDACVADVDGDGEMEILLKFDNRSDAENSYKPAGYNGEYAIIEVYKLNGKKLWWIDLGPNMTDFQNNENNIVAYDWDGDGKAEAVMRAADGTVIHKADGTTYEVGDMKANYRPANGATGGEFFVHEGNEFLLYLNGETGDVYQDMVYPLKRLEDGETDLNAAWGDGYGHRSTKHFFGAPVLDGRKASIFLARGIYTRHKMIAYDVDPATHRLTERWRWNCNTGGPWFGQGYHNYGIADVDWDGRDEIVFGSMVIDDNGKGLSTTGLGHGDAQHCSDFDPYSHGQEIFACGESSPGNNFRDATTSKIYYRYIAGKDDGRCIMGKFVKDIPGAQGTSARDPQLVSSVSHSGVDKGSYHISQNFRIYWDGDLCEESFNYANGKNTEGTIVKAETGNIAILEGSMTNNDTKGTPCFQGDILGDWREEVIMRTAEGNIRIYTTDIETPWRNYSLWHDHQYRQAMVWQMCGYNQPPHKSYFLGEIEGITVAPPPLTMTGREEIANNGSIGSAADGKHIMMCETNDMTVSVADGAKPYILTDNAPTWVQGHDDNNNITTDTYTHTLTGGAFTGEMRLVKQGDGVLNLPNVVQTYTGNTDIWAGVLNFDGTLQNSRLWLNRFAELNSSGGKFMKGIQMEYASVLRPGGKDSKDTVETDSLILNFGSRVELDIYSDGTAADMVKAAVLKIGTQDWGELGPKYSTPVLSVITHPADGADAIADGKYLIGEIGKIDGSLDDLEIEGLDKQKSTLTVEDGKLYLNISTYVPGDVTWTGSIDGNWNLDATENFVKDDSKESIVFVPGDNVTFDDNAVNTDIVVVGKVSPGSITFNNETKNFTISGDSLSGGAPLVKNGAGTVTINNVNSIGNTTINGGKIVVNTLANNIGQDNGSLGGVNDVVTINNNAVLEAGENITAAQPIVAGEGGATFEVPSGKTMTMSDGVRASSKESALTKTGGGTLELWYANNEIHRLIIAAGSVNSTGQLPDTVEFRGGTLNDPNSEGSFNTTSANFVVPKGSSGTLYADPRCDYTGKLKGEGVFNVYAAGVRNYFKGDWSEFEGTLVPGLSKRGTYDPWFAFDNNYGLPKATLQVNDGVTFDNNGHNVEIGNLTGKGILSGAGAYTIGSANQDITFSGEINSPVVKEGTGKWTIYSSSAQNNIGAVTVNAGSIYLSAFSVGTQMLGSNTVTVNEGASVSGVGTVGTLILNSGAELTPGMTGNDPTGGIGTKKILNAKAGSVINLHIVSNANSAYSRTYLDAGTFLMISGTVNVTLSDSYTPAIGDKFTLWECNTFSGNPTFNLPELPVEMEWDITGLKSKTGVLAIVAKGTGISVDSADESVHCRMYTTSGMFVGEFDAAATEVTEKAKSMGAAPGTYVLKLNTQKSSSTVKVVIR